MLRRLTIIIAANVLFASSAVAEDAIQYDRGDVTFSCAQLVMTDLNTGLEKKGIETFKLMLFPKSETILGADQFLSEYREGSAKVTTRLPEKLSGTFNVLKGQQRFEGSITVTQRTVGDEYDNGKITLEKVPLSFVIVTKAQGGGRVESLRYKGFCGPPGYESAAGSNAHAPAKLEPGCFVSNGEKFCQ
jgi:hypothetical protein